MRSRFINGLPLPAMIVLIMSGMAGAASAQNVGIGTNTPEAKLHVNGDFKLQTGVVVNTISADSSFAPGSDSILPTQKALKRYVQKGNWLPPVGLSLLFVDSVSTAAFTPAKVFVQGNYAYVTGYNGVISNLTIYDISDPKNVVAKGSTSTNLVGPSPCFVQGNYAYVASPYNNHLCIFDVSDPNNIIPKAFTTQNMNNPLGLSVHGNYAYVSSTGTNLLSIFDISDPNNIVAKGTLVTATISNAMCVQGNYAYTTGGNRLSIFDISDPNNIIPKAFSTANLVNGADVWVQDNYAYVISYGSHVLCIYDISDPNNIVAKGVVSANSANPVSVRVQGNYAYVTGNDHTLRVFRVSDPDNIVPVASSGTNLSGPGAMAVRGNYIYVASTINKRFVTYTFTGAGTIVSDGSGSLSMIPDVWETNGLNAFRMYGNIGVGVVDPINKLDVNGNTNITGSTYISDRAGIGTNSPVNKLDVEGSAVIGSSYSGTNAAPANGLLVEGNIGIGVTDPANKLSIAGGITVDRGLANIGTIVNTVKFGGENSGEGVGSKKNAGGNQNGLDFYTNYIIRMSVTNGGFVGIGTTSPTAPLEVSASTVSNIGSYAYLAGSGTGFSSSASSPVSIRAAARIVAAEFDAVSDQRIKRNITTSSSQHDLATLLKIRVADYQIKDSVFHGNGITKGFIAQELERVMPQAVHINADYVPDIYCLSTVTQYNEKDKTLKISLCKPHQLKAGDKVKVFAGDGMQEQYVTAINSENEFTLGNWEIKQAGMNPVEKVFVWGKWVTDFHTVDYNQVFSMGISAIQQLAKENEEQKKINQSLQQQIDELKKLIFKK